ncbi:hypothetical protein ACPV3A_34490, partial [Paenibacillus sp. Dod16]|uniref:hypothetical protein n=1 Tax=Paenibacillus sp. Dod16 TaxID=3416392 RepID=UPI003CF12091
EGPEGPHPFWDVKDGAATFYSRGFLAFQKGDEPHSRFQNIPQRTQTLTDRRFVISDKTAQFRI